ncbi:ethylene-responsive transcription factor ERF019-like [Prosopis cineraria]|uniref:ethylene-responsive transcription factor ERF019-like n=1 Tax=Prosopis cineraria TaxID=364024 RepID=UPI00240FCE7C|nr:ethylene-responsive transcription factor ERF019-like [Prosopis cineraria]
MSCSSGDNNASRSNCRDAAVKYKGVRQRKWGKWVSEIRVPGSQERLWLGTFASPEAAAVARDVAYYCLRRPASLDKLNLPGMLPPCYVRQPREMSPRSVQEAASNAGMAVDARRIVEAEVKNEKTGDEQRENREMNDEFWWDSSGGGGGIWDGMSDGHTQGEAPSISIDDYLIDLLHS